MWISQLFCWLLSCRNFAKIEETYTEWMGSNETIKSRKFDEDIRREKPF